MDSGYVLCFENKEYVILIAVLFAAVLHEFMDLLHM